MTSEPPSPLLDLLVVGGLTIDRFADGPAAPGGSVMHVGRSATKRGLSVGIVTSAGTEPEAVSAVSELNGLVAWLEVSEATTTATFRHREGPQGRRLWLERPGGTITLGADARDRIHTRSILYAPVAGEVGAESLAVWDESWSRGAILQGWLRRTRGSGRVEPISLESMDGAAVAALATFDLIIASREDLVADAAKPDDQLDRLRSSFGPKPSLVVSEGIGGLWIDVAGMDHGLGRRHHIPVPFVVEGMSTVGAGDVLAAFLTAWHGDPAAGWVTRVREAMRIVAEDLAARRADG